MKFKTISRKGSFFLDYGLYLSLSWLQLPPQKIVKLDSPPAVFRLYFWYSVTDRRWPKQGILWSSIVQCPSVSCFSSFGGSPNRLVKTWWCIMLGQTKPKSRSYLCRVVKAMLYFFVIFPLFAFFSRLYLSVIHFYYYRLIIKRINSSTRAWSIIWNSTPIFQDIFFNEFLHFCYFKPSYAEKHSPPLHHFALHWNYADLILDFKRAFFI